MHTVATGRTLLFLRIRFFLWAMRCFFLVRNIFAPACWGKYLIYKISFFSQVQINKKLKSLFWPRVFQIGTCINLKNMKRCSVSKLTAKEDEKFRVFPKNSGHLTQTLLLQSYLSGKYLSDSFVKCLQLEYLDDYTGCFYHY